MAHHADSLNRASRTPFCKCAPLAYVPSVGPVCMHHESVRIIDANCLN